MGIQISQSNVRFVPGIKILHIKQYRSSTYLTGKMYFKNMIGLMGLVLVLVCSSSSGQEDCANKAEDKACEYWKYMGYCTHRIVERMKENCAKTCGYCSSAD